MKAYRYVLFMLALFLCVGMKGQYNPTNPSEPGVAQSYTLTLKATPEGGGSFNIGTTTTYVVGNTINLRAYANSNFVFVAWKQDGEVISTQAYFTYTMPAKNVTLVAEFSYSPANPTEPSEPIIPEKPVYSSLKLTSNPSGGGYFNISSGNQYEVGSTVWVRAYNNSNFEFQNWTENGEIISTSTGFNYVMKDGNPELVANFIYNPGSPGEPAEPRLYHRLFLEANPEAGGYFNVASGNEYQEGSQIWLYAYSNQWYTFQNWTIGDEVVSTSNGFTYTMPKGDVTLKANYTYLYNPSNPSEPSEQIGQLNVYGMTESGFRGQTITYPVYLENPTQVYGLDVDIQFPEGFVVNTKDVVLSNRASGHQMTVIDLGNNNFRFCLRGNTYFTENNGKLFDVKVTIPVSAVMENTYPVVLTHGVVHSPDGQQFTIPVRNGNIFVEKISEDGLYARFTYDKLHARVLFTNLSSDKAKSFKWDFGDGETSTEREPLHVYQKSGTFVVKLSATGQTDTDVAEMMVLINDHSAWRVDGTFYLHDQVKGVRYYTTAEELFQVLGSYPVVGDIGIAVQAGHTFNEPLSEANLPYLRSIQSYLSSSSYKMKLSKNESGNTPILGFGTKGQAVNKDVVDLFIELGKNMTCEDVDVQLWGISFNPAQYHRQQSQQVESGSRTAVADFQSISKDLKYEWILLSPSSLQGVPLNGEGNIPSFTVINTGDDDIVITYQVKGLYGGATFCEFTYQYIVTPSKMVGADLLVSDIIINKKQVSPGDEVTVSWTVDNMGDREFTGGWKEKLSFVSDDEERLFTTVRSSVESLGVDGHEQRSVTANIPLLPGINGEIRLRIQLIPENESNEPLLNQTNNMSESDIFQMAKLLVLDLPKESIMENTTRPIKGVLSRSGSWKSQESFTMNMQGDARLVGPQQLVIPPEQAAVTFYINVQNNKSFDKDSIFTFTVSGNGYEPVVGKVIVIDDELDALTLTASKSEVTEGESFQLTVKTDRIPDSDVTLTITCEDSKRFSFPAEVVLPAGSSSVTIDVIAVDNAEIELQESVAFTVSAPGFNDGECVILLNDNDMPTLSLSLTPTEVSESAGSSAVIGTIRRTDNFDKEVVFKLSDDSGGRLTYPASVTMAKDQEEVQFSIGVVDNGVVDGNKVIQFTAAVYAASCSCSIPADDNGKMTQKLTIIDNDGAALAIKTSVNSLLEGSTGNVFVISHNVVTDHDVTVRISSDMDDMLVYPHEVTIPAGSSSAQLLVDVKRNDQFGDSNLVTFKVEADGYSMATLWIVITDQTLPDAAVTLSAEKTEVEAEETVKLNVEVSNVGYHTLPAETMVKIYFSGVRYAETLKTDKALEPGESTTLDFEYELPAITGNYSWYATVNENHSVQELVYANNTSESVSVTLLPKFRVTAKADKDVYVNGETITISGQADGSAGKNARVEVYLINEGSRQSMMVISDDDGHFSMVWPLHERQSGHFIIGACYPGTGETTEMDAFDVYGIRLNSFFTTCQFGLTETYSGTIKVTNPGELVQTGLKVEPQATSENCEFTFSSVDQIGPGETVSIDFTIKGNGLTEGVDWQQMPIVISTKESSSAGHTIYYYVQSLTGALRASTTQINTTMTLGQTREYPITVTNVGKGETGAITLSLPNWMSSTTAHEMASLQPGDSTTVVLRFVPNEEMKLNVPVAGQLGINCANGNGVAIHFNITPVSEQKGDLIVDVVDELTFFTAEAPHVANAKVIVKSPLAGTVIAEGLTDNNGIFATNIPEGWYKITVEAANHKSYNNTLIVDPGIDNEVEVFLAYEAITYSWDVVETEIEDIYEIETVANYDTRVPKPVVIITLPDNAPEPYSIVPVAVTNLGLINAVNVNMSLTTDNDYYFEFLNDPSLDTLRAKQTYVFYAKMLPASENVAGAKKRNDNSSQCFTMIGKAKYQELCEKYDEEEFAIAMKKWGTHHCVTSGGSGGGGGGGGIGGGTITGGGGSGGYGGGGSGPGSPNLGTGNHNYDDVYIIYDTENPAKYCTPPTPLPSVPEGELEVVGCGEPFELHYILISNDGNRNLMKGAAADGASQLQIVLDVTKSKIPSPECGYTITWSIPEGCGKLEKTDSWDHVVYTAPDDYPMTSKKEFKFDIKMNFTNEGVYNVVENSGEVTIPVILTRAPVLLIHGLNSDKSAWTNFASYLTTAPADENQPDSQLGGMYDDYQVYCVDYSEFNCAHFKVNQKRPRKAIELVTRRYKEHGIMATKADLIGHSMGGILSRLHVQYEEGGRDNVHKVITVNTPHSGSEIGDMVMSSSLLKNAINVLHVGGFSSTDAIDDLSVNSEEIDNYLNNPEKLSMMNGIPVHALSSNVVDKWGSLANGLIGGAAFLFTSRSWDLSLLDFISKLGLKKALNATFALEMETALAVSDLVVPLASQKGGLSGSHTINHTGEIGEACHTEVTNNQTTWDDLVFLLKEPVNSDFFSLDGFHPVNRSVFAGNHKKSAKSLIKEADSSLNLNLRIVDDSLFVEMDPRYADVDNQCIIATFSDGEMATGRKQMAAKIPSVHEGPIKVGAIVMTDDDVIVKGENSIMVSSAKARPVRLEIPSDIYMMSDDTLAVKLNCIWDDGSETRVIPDEATTTDGIAAFKNGHIMAKKAGKSTIKFLYKDLSVSCPLTVYKSADPGNDMDGDDSESVCSTITLSFKQKMVMTRQAFRGTLTVNNGSETGAMEDVKLNLVVRDTDGKVTTSHEFQINPESLNGFTGDLNFNSGWRLGAKSTGVATVLFIPTKYAAPTGPKDYAFGGTFSYKDPTSGLYVTRDLNPVTLTVKPSPELDLTYFLQRDVFGDDPLTEEVEPSYPAEFALLINNKGYGDATNVRMTTNQPEIVDNEKGLLIDFELLSSQVNGGDANLAFGSSIINDFGTIPSRSQSYAQWWLQSSLLGHFTKYDVKASHMTSYGNEDLSLLDQVTIHELIHGFGVDGGRGFLVNDIPDQADRPDQVYLTDATQHDVQMASGMTITRHSDTEYVLSVSVGKPGWTYGALQDPTLGNRAVLSVVRQSDGKVLPVDNVWQTDRTLRDGKDPLYENRLHFVGEVLSSTESYLVTFGEMADVQLAVVGFRGLPDEGSMSPVALTEVVVEFNKPIQPVTFTADDLRLTCQGTPMDVSGVTITQAGETEYAINLSGLTQNDGYYVLTVNTVDITDADGFQGMKGKSASWIQYSGQGLLTEKSLSGLVISLRDGQPVEGAVITLKHQDLTYTAQTDSEGAYVITVDDTSLSYDLTCSAEEYLDKVEEDVTIPDRGLMLDFSLERGATILLPDDGICTYSGSVDLDFTRARKGEVKAYYVKSFTSSTVFIEETPDAVADEGLILIGTPLARIDVPEAEVAAPISDNLLVGTGFAPYKVVSDDVYVLTTKMGKLKFQRAAEGLVIPRHKAYIILLSDMIISQNNGADVVIGDPTSLGEIRMGDNDNPHYGIGGSPIHEKARGVHIQKGKKFVIK